MCEKYCIEKGLRFFLDEGRVFLQRADSGDLAEVRRAFTRSRSALEPWIYRPEDFDAWLSDEARMLVRLKENGQLAGQFNLSGIIRYSLQQAFLGYNAFEPHMRKGCMKEAMPLMLWLAFEKLRLHRIEANIQPANTPSLAFISNFGFRNEGYSLRYLNIGGQWRDHVRMALTSEDCGELLRKIKNKVRIENGG